MRIFTNQPLYVWEKLQKEKLLYIDADNEHFASILKDRDNKITHPEPYDWLLKQLQKRIEGYGTHYCWWGWIHKPDLRYETWAWYKGDNAVRIELEIPDNKILLSHFEAWHCILNGQYLPYTEEEDEEFDKIIDPYNKRKMQELIALKKDNGGVFPKNIPREKDEECDKIREQIEKTWERVFDIENLITLNYWGDSNIQVNFEELSLNQVKKVTCFVGRQKRL